MPERDRFGGDFGGFTIQFCVPDIRAGVTFYSRLLGRPPNFEPYEDFKEWDGIGGCTIQIAEGEPRPGYPLRFRVEDIEAGCARVARDLGVACSPVERIPGLVAFCNFDDPWGNRLGFYQRLFVDEPRVPGGLRPDADRGAPGTD